MIEFQGFKGLNLVLDALPVVLKASLVVGLAFSFACRKVNQRKLLTL